MDTLFRPYAIDGKQQSTQGGSICPGCTKGTRMMGEYLSGHSKVDSQRVTIAHREEHTIKMVPEAGFRAATDNQELAPARGERPGDLWRGAPDGGRPGRSGAFRSGSSARRHFRDAAAGG